MENDSIAKEVNRTKEQQGGGMLVAVFDKYIYDLESEHRSKDVYHFRDK